MKAEAICQQAASLVSGDRNLAHGEMSINHANIAALWNAYLGPRAELTPHDVALLMALLKIARTKSGDVNFDDYVDGAGYMGVAGELADDPAR